MNKNDLIDAIATEADLSKASAGRALDAALGAITSALSKQETVSLVGFGTFAVKHRAAREGRNPRTGDTTDSRLKCPQLQGGQGAEGRLQLS